MENLWTSTCIVYKKTRSAHVYNQSSFPCRAQSHSVMRAGWRRKRLDERRPCCTLLASVATDGRCFQDRMIGYTPASISPSCVGSSGRPSLLVWHVRPPIGRDEIHQADHLIGACYGTEQIFRCRLVRNEPATSTDRPSPPSPSPARPPTHRCCATGCWQRRCRGRCTAPVMTRSRKGVSWLVNVSSCRETYPRGLGPALPGYQPESFQATKAAARGSAGICRATATAAAPRFILEGGCAPSGAFLTTQSRL